MSARGNTWGRLQAARKAARALADLDELLALQTGETPRIRLYQPDLDAVMEPTLESLAGALADMADDCLRDLRRAGRDAARGGSYGAQ